ncbi:MAG: type IV secretion protein DotG [Alphaproteobacteria bacterium]|nr:type IV secretion protein DotG [Alphaproteobacteria bacterium]NCQ88416.1 type IV secretion protein DotG [Alphaproteobacteria bacterium]NCT05958.1 type IV secretion protein DotG [Alphaproteobacteria bacterium]
MSSSGDFDTEDFDLGEFDDSGFDDVGGQNTLSDIWKNNPIVKFVVIGGAVVLLIIGFIVFGKKSESVPVSMVSGNSEVAELPGQNEVSPAFQQAIEDVNERRVEEAIRTGESTMPMSADPMKGTIPLQFEEPDEEDPLERWRRLQEERIRQQQAVVPEPAPQPVPVQQQPQPVDTVTPAINALSPAMSAQIEGILNGQFEPTLNVVQVANQDYLEGLQEEANIKLEKELEKQNQAIAAAAEETTIIEDILLPAGTIEYGQLITEANTDAPGPVLAIISSGPLKGSRIIGSFTATDNYLTLSFNTVVIDGVSYSADAVAIDPNTTLPGIVTEVDNRYFKRVMLPTAAAFITGLTEAISESGTTTVTINNETVTEESQDQDSGQEVASGIADAGEEIEELLNEIADGVEPMIRVAAGTPIGILFTSAVTSGTSQ